jgi:muconolactone delta-isomerase
MKILALERNVQGATEENLTDALLKEEATRAWQLHQSGVIREMYFRADRHASILMLECATVVEANAVLSTLPLVQEGLIEFDVIPLVAYPGFARLFVER